MAKQDKTNAIRILEKEQISYIEHTYESEDGLIDGVSVAQKCGENPDFVFKTLVTHNDHQEYFVFVIPVAEKLDLKKAAKSVNQKHISMLPQKELLPLTGYIHGGCSPIGMKKKFITVYDEVINLIDRIYVSGGKIGIQVELDPKDLLRITDGMIADVLV